MSGRLAKMIGGFLCAFIWIVFLSGGQAAGAAVSPLVLGLGEAREYGFGGSYNNFWDLQKNISVTFGKGEFFSINYSSLSPRLTYQGGEGGGFLDAGTVSKPAGQEAFNVTPALLSYSNTIDIQAGHLYVLRTATMGYFALYADDIQIVDDEPHLNFTLYEMKGQPFKSLPQPQPQPQPQPGENNSGRQQTAAPPSGSQTITLPGGAVYTGEVSDGLPHGAGTMTWPDGATYRGEWKNGKQHGDGTKTYASGDKYVGEWKNGLRDGWGIYSWLNGDKYDGNWKEGKMNGQGKFTSAAGEVKEGLWQDDRFAGSGVHEGQTSAAPKGTDNRPENQEVQKPPASVPATPPAGQSPVVQLDGKTLSFDVPPLIDNGRTLVPLRVIFVALGATVDWDGTTGTVKATKDGIQIKLQLGAQTAYKNGSPISLDVPGKTVNGRTLVPLRFVSEALGAKVDWNEQTQTVSIAGSSSGPVPAAPVNAGRPGTAYWVESDCRLVREGQVVFDDQHSIQYPFIRRPHHLRR